MNADRLLTHYERIADAPDAIVRFRRFILDLAVRGNLVEQDPNDEPASKLLKRIASEKARLVKTGKIKKQKIIPTLLGQDMPCPLPVNWRWSQIAEIGVLSPRNDVDDDVQSSFVPMPLIASGYGLPIEHEVRQWGEIKKGYTHFAEGDVGLAKITPCFQNGKSAVFRNLTGGLGSGTTELHIVRPLFVDPDYILIFLKCSHFIEAGISKMTGTAGQKRVPTEYFASSSFPLPPLAEQHRIVAKVDELMALCERLEAARAEREATRDRLSAASLARLNVPAHDPDTFRNHASFALENLAPLTTRLDQIKALRQTILNLAVRGKLVEQDPNDEPASELLQRIEEEKWDCTNHDRRRNDESDPSSSATPTVSIPLPPNWTWARLKDLIVAGPQNGLSPRPSEREDAPRALTLTATTSGVFDRSHFKRVEAEIGPDSEFWLQPNDLLFQRGNTREYVGMAAIYDGPPGEFIFPDLMMRVRLSPEINLNFIHLVCISPSARSYFSQNATGAQKTMPKINQIILRALPIPIPPLAEQHRIVATVEELMTLCDRLEGGLGAADTTRHRLFESLIQEALEPAANELQTAR